MAHRTFLADRRQAAGLSQRALAEAVGISRQALSAIEAGRSVPSTVLSLRLARVLGCTVEALFALPAEAVPGLRAPALAGRRVALAQVGTRWAAHPLPPTSATPADGIVAADGSIEPLCALSELSGVVLVAGCAPILGVLAGGGARWLPHTSGAALRALASGQVHVAGMHLARRDEPGAHERLVRDALPGVAVEIIRLIVWREGVAVAPGNPLGLRSSADLGRPGLRVAQRPAGSGAARVLSAALAEAGIASVSGPSVATHADAAQALVHGAADAAVLAEPVAEAFGLGFVPLVEERFELVVRSADRGHAGLVRLRERLESSRFSREVRSMGAYDVADIGHSRRLGA